MISHEGIRCVRGKNLRDFLSQIAAISQVGDSGNLRQLGTDNRAPNRPSNFLSYPPRLSLSIPPTFCLIPTLEALGLEDSPRLSPVLLPSNYLSLL